MYDWYSLRDLQGVVSHVHFFSLCHCFLQQRAICAPLLMPLAIQRSLWSGVSGIRVPPTINSHLLHHADRALAGRALAVLRVVASRVVIECACNAVRQRTRQNACRDFQIYGIIPGNGRVRGSDTNCVSVRFSLVKLIVCPMMSLAMLANSSAL